MVTIAVDAMGGDKAPVPEVEGAFRAAREFGHRIVLVGDRPLFSARSIISFGAGNFH